MNFGDWMELFSTAGGDLSQVDFGWLVEQFEAEISPEIVANQISSGQAPRPRQVAQGGEDLCMDLDEEDILNEYWDDIRRNGIQPDDDLVEVLADMHQDEEDEDALIVDVMDDGPQLSETKQEIEKYLFYEKECVLLRRRDGHWDIAKYVPNVGWEPYYGDWMNKAGSINAEEAEDLRKELDSSQISRTVP